MEIRGTTWEIKCSCGEFISADDNAHKSKCLAFQVNGLIEEYRVTLEVPAEYITMTYDFEPS